MKYYDALTKLVQAYEKEMHKKRFTVTHKIFHSASNTPAVDILVNGQKVIKTFHLNNLVPI